MKYFTLIVLILFTACSQREPKINSFQHREIQALPLAKEQDQLQNKFELAQNSLDENAQWFGSNEKLDLKIFVELNNDKVYKMVYAVLETLKNDKELKNRYKSISIVKYSYGSDDALKIDAAYSNRLYSKDKLNDVLRSANLTKNNYKECSISVDIDALDDKKFIIEGYKTIKYLDKKLNSHYYSLAKDINNKLDSKLIKNAILATLQLNIPEYLSIDRDDIKTSKVLKIVNQKPDGSYEASAYKMKIDNALNILKKQKEQELLKSPNNKINIELKYNKKISKIQNSKKWIKFKTKQLLFTTPISQSDIDTLYEYKYIDNKYDYENININEAKQISKALNVQLPDYYLSLSFETYRKLLNQFEINIGSVHKFGDTYFIKSSKQAQSDSSNETTAAFKNTATALTNGFIMTFSALAKSSFSTNTYSNAQYTYVKPDLQKGKFYPTSMFAYEYIGIEKIYNNTFSNFDHSSFSFPAKKEFFIHKENNELVLLNEDQTKAISFNIKNKKIKEIDSYEFMYILNSTDIEKFKKLDKLVKARYEDPPAWRPKQAEFDAYRYKLNKILEHINSDYQLYMNTGEGSQTIGGRCDSQLELSSNNNIVPNIITLDNGSYIQTYECSPYIDLFDKDKNFITRYSEHQGVIINTSLTQNSNYIITEGSLGAKIWSVRAFEFISKKF